MPMIIPGGLAVGDTVRIAMSRDYDCDECAEDIGWDYEMDDYIGDVVEVRTLNPEFRLRCGAEVFSSGPWLWTTCWIDNWWGVTEGRTPDWEV